MADSELGEARRSPRPMAHRIERLARWRAQGLAHGESDATFPSASSDEQLAASWSGGDVAETATAVPQWSFDDYAVVAASTSPWTLTYTPLPYSEVVSLNGVRLRPDTDYTIVGRTLDLPNLATLIAGIGGATWRLVINYAYVDEAGLEQPDVVIYGNGLSTGSTYDFGSLGTSGDLYYQNGAEGCDAVIYITGGDSTAPSGIGATWSQLVNGSGASAIDVWLGVGSLTSGVITKGTSSYAVAYALRGVEGTVSVRGSAIVDLTDGNLTSVSAAAVTAVVGDVVLSAALGLEASGDYYYPIPSTSSGTGFENGPANGRQASCGSPDVGRRNALAADLGIATGTSLDYTWAYVNDADGGITSGTGQVLNLVLQVT